MFDPQSPVHLTSVISQWARIRTSIVIADCARELNNNNNNW